MIDSHAKLAAQSLRVLLVDDNRNGLCARKSVLEGLGFLVNAFTSSVEALEAFQEGEFDLVVTDYRMPKMNGAELIASIREVRPGMPVVLVSGVVDAFGLTEVNTGADAVISKSANEVNHLIRAVHRLTRPAKKPSKSQSSRSLRARTKRIVS